MGIADITYSPRQIDSAGVIDDETLVVESRVASPIRMHGPPSVDAPPLTLYGAYRQGIADYFARRPNPYRNGSRLAEIWQEGCIEAASRNAWRIR